MFFILIASAYCHSSIGIFHLLALISKTSNRKFVYGYNATPKKVSIEFSLTKKMTPTVTNTIDKIAPSVDNAVGTKVLKKELMKQTTKRNN